MIIAVDFDGTLAVDAYPNIGEPRWEVIDFVKARKECGDTIILWTCRGGTVLQKAVEWARVHGIKFDYVNENCPKRNALYGGDSRKISADVYIDDRGINPHLAKSIVATFTAARIKLAV